ncbi:MAG: hypothetical protein ACREVA_02435 [Burkholderiales bacterium]
MNRFTMLLYGEGGTGKTTSTLSFLKPANLEKEPKLCIRYLCADPNALLGIRDGIRIHKLHVKPGQLTTMVVKPTTSRNMNSKDSANEFQNNFMKLDDSDAMKVKTGVQGRIKKNLFLQILYSIAEYKGIDWVTEEVVDYGDYLDWEPNVIFVIDSLTTVLDYLGEVVRGSRQLAVISDFNAIEALLMTKVITPISQQALCSIVLLTHAHFGLVPNVKQPKEYDQQIRQVYPRTHGQALNSVLPSKFNETCYMYIELSKYLLAGRKPGAFTSTRQIPKQDKLIPDFSLYDLITSDI